ncbi:MAG: cation:proton antiporter [Azospirillaceae bacterium]
MDSHAHDITALALAVGIAVVCGIAMTRMRQPAIVGYILAGVVLGPTALGLVENTGSVSILAELGVLMLLFIIGMELSLRALLSVLTVALLCMVLQLTAALGIGFGIGWLAGWSTAQSLVISFAISLSSTAVAIKILEEIGELRTQIGRITIGVLIAQDLAIVPMILIASSLGEAVPIAELAVKIAAAVAVLALVIWLLNRRGRKIDLPIRHWLRGQHDLVPLVAMAICFIAATLSGLLGLSAAYGAFIAGLVIANTTDRKVMLRATQPIQAVLLMVFFLSIGLLLDLTYIWNNFWLVAGLLLATILAKSVLNVVILRALGEPFERAFPAGLAMAQIGEFSFVLTGVALANGALDQDFYRLGIAIIALSLLASPLWMISARRFHVSAARGISGARLLLVHVYRRELRGLRRVRRLVRTALSQLGHALYWLFHLAVYRRRPPARDARPAGLLTGPATGEAPRSPGDGEERA